MLSLVIYLLMGWLALVAIVPLWTALSPAGFAWLAAGGLFYTVGIIFYVADQRVRHGHGVWHASPSAAEMDALDQLFAGGRA